jgi:hypothetical protein
MNKTLHLLCLLIVVALNSRAQTSEQLETAYHENSTEKLKAFFDAWANELKPATPKQRKKMSKTVQQAYKVFEAFYNPHDIANHGGSEFGNDIYTGFNFLIIQNEFKIFQREKVYWTEQEARDYAINNILKNISPTQHNRMIASINSGKMIFVDSYGPNGRDIWQDKSRVMIDSVTNFRPGITQTAATPLYLTDKYRKILDSFLGNDHIPFGEGDIMNPALPKDESAKRLNFLRNYIKIYLGHWGTFWHYTSDPSIGALIFDNDMKHARIQYTMIYEGGEAFLEYQDNAWKLISTKRTWIE